MRRRGKRRKIANKTGRQPPPQFNKFLKYKYDGFVHAAKNKEKIYGIDILEENLVVAFSHRMKVYHIHNQRLQKDQNNKTSADYCEYCEVSDLADHYTCTTTTTTNGKTTTTTTTTTSSSSSTYTENFSTQSTDTNNSTTLFELDSGDSVINVNDNGDDEIDDNEIDEEDEEDEIDVAKNKIGLELISEIVDDDIEEEFYVVKWGIDPGNHSLIIAAGGKRGILKLIELNHDGTSDIIKLYGHGCHINDLQFHPHHNDLILTASGDHSIRLWDLQVGKVVAIFAGHNGHREQVLSIDFHFTGTKFVSSGMDNACKIWQINDEIYEYIHWIRHRQTITSKSTEKDIPLVQFPIFSNQEIHSYYVDCVKFVGNMVLSKSSIAEDVGELGNNILCWIPQSFVEDVKIKKFSTTHTFYYLFQLQGDVREFWFLRFALSNDSSTLCLCSCKGYIEIYDLSQLKGFGTKDQKSDIPTLKPIQKNCPGRIQTTKPIRNVSFTTDDHFMFVVDDMGNIYRYSKHP